MMEGEPRGPIFMEPSDAELSLGRFVHVGISWDKIWRDQTCAVFRIPLDSVPVIPLNFPIFALSLFCSYTPQVADILRSTSFPISCASVVRRPVTLISRLNLSATLCYLASTTNIWRHHRRRSY